MIKTKLVICISVERDMASVDYAKCPNCHNKVELDNSILSNPNIAQMERAADNISRLQELYLSRGKTTLDNFLRKQKELLSKIEECPTVSLVFNTYVQCEQCLKHLTLLINAELPKLPQAPNISELKAMKLGDSLNTYLASMLGEFDLNNDVTFRSVMNYLCYGHLETRSNTGREIIA